jgi:hypothetical protein
LKVRVLLRPVAFCALLLLGVAPAATLACELVCAAPGGHGDHRSSADTSHHEHPSAAVDARHAPAEAASIRAFASNCEHDIAIAPGLISSAVKLFMPAPIDAGAFAASDVDHRHVTSVRDAAGGPPGPHPGSLPLRI